MEYRDSLFRVSFKCLITDEQGRVLVIKEKGRTSWDLPGGGIDHGETIESSIRRELREEAGFSGDFSYKVLAIDDPARLVTRDVWQIKVIVRVTPASMDFSLGKEADEIAYVDPTTFKDSAHASELSVYRYALLYL